MKPGFSNSVESTIVVRVFIWALGPRRSRKISCTPSRSDATTLRTAVLAGDVMTLEDAGMLLHLAHAGLIADVVAGAVPYGDERGDGQADLGAIELHPIAADVSRLLKTFNAFHDGGTGEANFVGNCLVARSTILAENAKNPAIGCVELGLGGHLGGSLVCS